MRLITILLLITVISTVAFTAEFDPRPEDIPFPFGSEKSPVGCVEFWDAILKLPPTEIARGKLETYPSTGVCREVPPAFRWLHEQYLERCEPAYAPSLPTATALLNCGGITVQYRMALRGWKHRDGKKLNRLSKSDSWELLIHLLGYYGFDRDDTQYHRSALDLARRFSEAEPKNMEAAYLHLNALDRSGEKIIPQKEKKEEVRKIAIRIATLMREKKWYPHEKFRGIGFSYLESAYGEMEKVGEAKALRELLSGHTYTKSAAYYFEACTQTGENRQKLMKLAAQDSDYPQFEQYLSRQPAYQCGRVPPQLFNPSMHFALAMGLGLPWELYP